MNQVQLDKNRQSFISHVRFWEKQVGWPHFSDEEIKEAYARRCGVALRRQEETRLRARLPLSQEEIIKQSLPGGVGLRPIQVIIRPVLQPKDAVRAPSLRRELTKPRKPIEL